MRTRSRNSFFRHLSVSICVYRGNSPRRFLRPPCLRGDVLRLNLASYHCRTNKEVWQAVTGWPRPDLEHLRPLANSAYFFFGGGASDCGSSRIQMLRKRTGLPWNCNCTGILAAWAVYCGGLSHAEAPRICVWFCTSTPFCRTVTKAGRFSLPLLRRTAGPRTRCRRSATRPACGKRSPAAGAACRWKRPGRRSRSDCRTNRGSGFRRCSS